MVIFKDYNTSDVLFDEPYVEDGRLTLYPVKVKDFKILEKRIMYLLLSKRHYKLDNNVNLFEYVVGINLARVKQEKEKRSNDEVPMELILEEVVKEFEELFTVICREKIKLDYEKMLQTGEISFTNKDHTNMINRNNYEKIRQIVLKQNAIKEPTIFENKLEEQLAQKYMKAMQSKNKGKSISELGDIANFVSCYTGKSYEELYNQNIMQLQADYYRCISLNTHRTNTIFGTVSDKVKINGLNEEVISKLSIFAGSVTGILFTGEALSLLLSLKASTSLPGFVNVVK